LNLPFCLISELCFFGQKQIEQAIKIIAPEQLFYEKLIKTNIKKE
jgi:hypothetical protein